MTAPTHDWFTPELVELLRQQGNESPWCEFKLNNCDPAKVGDTLAALANGALLAGQPFGYLVFGVADDLSIEGTSIRVASERAGGEPLSEWLARHLEPRPSLAFARLEVGGAGLEAIRIPAAAFQPTAFQGRERIRIESRNQPLRDYPDHSRRLWERLSGQSFESRVLSGPHDGPRVAELLDLTAFARLRGLTGQAPAVVLNTLVQDGGIVRHDDGRMGITALGALLFAKQLSHFRELERRVVRVIEYPGIDRVDLGMREFPGSRGYAAGFDGLLGFVMEHVPAQETLVGGVRRPVPVYPLIALREFIANALIHQDLSMHGTGPVIEIFRDRVEISNPGIPLNEPDRLLDLPARSRNEQLAVAMRRVGLCEERGSGIDRAVAAIEEVQLPAPEITAHGDHTRVIVLGPRPLAQMTQLDRLRACYQHACLLWVGRVPLTNASLRRRLGIADGDYSMVSRIISDTVEAGLVKPFDASSTSRRHAKYVPSWAQV